MDQSYSQFCVKIFIFVQYIEIPELTKFPTSSSFSFHTWVCLDSTSFKKKYGAELDDDDETPKSFKRRRVLYR